MNTWSEMRIAAALVLSVPTLVFLLSKCFFLAPYRAGWLMMVASLVYETLFKKFHWERWPIDAAALVILSAGWLVVAGPWAGSVISLGMALAWAYTMWMDIR